MTMKRLFPIVFALFAGAGGLSAQRNIVDFYEIADSVASHPPFRNELTTLCQVRVLDRWVSFVGFKSTKTALYVTFTLDSLADPVTDVSPIVGYEKARPVLGKVATWGYLFDRNRDGKVDYLALVGGAAPFEDADFPPNFPRQGEPMMIGNVELFVEKCKIIFTHWADDNYDGMIDGTVQADMDPDRAWVYRQILARSTKFDGRFDHVTAFRDDDSPFSDTLSFTPDRVSHRPVGMPAGSFGMKELDDKSAVMALINQAVTACAKGAFRLSPGQQPPPGQ
jgi:hypothetical protein